LGVQPGKGAWVFITSIKFGRLGIAIPRALDRAGADTSRARWIGGPRWSKKGGGLGSLWGGISKESFPDVLHVRGDAMWCVVRRLQPSSR